MIFGYARVSTEEQNLDMQVDVLKKFGVDKIYQEKITGTRKDRFSLEAKLRFFPENPTLEIKLFDYSE